MKNYLLQLPVNEKKIKEMLSSGTLLRATFTDHNCKVAFNPNLEDLYITKLLLKELEDEKI